MRKNLVEKAYVNLLGEIGRRRPLFYGLGAPPNRENLDHASSRSKERRVVPGKLFPLLFNFLENSNQPFEISRKKV
jgi:hypothetical protein